MPGTYFYPRSPCGERPTTRQPPTTAPHFYPRSPCGERLEPPEAGTAEAGISIHALLAESDVGKSQVVLQYSRFLSTLSLRRATPPVTRRARNLSNFYPRSPCGERLYPSQWRTLARDFYPRSPCGERRRSRSGRTSTTGFLSTLSLRRATQLQYITEPVTIISIHALLAESDPERF